MGCKKEKKKKKNLAVFLLNKACCLFFLRIRKCYSSEDNWKVGEFTGSSQPYEPVVIVAAESVGRCGEVSLPPRPCLHS